MQKKGERGIEKKRWLSERKLALIAVLLVLLVVSGILLPRFLMQIPKPEFSLKAAIIDQLGKEYPNQGFNSTGPVAVMLKNAGFNVSCYKSSAIDVAFYRNLAEGNYGLIVLRSHAALREDETLVDFFTSEEFSENRYGAEQADGLLAKGYYSREPSKFYFTITSRFIERLEGSFPKSIVVAMGCNSLNRTATEMAEAFISKGATAYVGWTGLVGSTHTDDETIKLLQAFVKEGKTLREALNLLQRDPTSGSYMKCYPPTTEDLKLSDLTAEKTTFAMFPGSFADSRPFFAISERDAAAHGPKVPALHGVRLVCQAFESSEDGYV